MFVGTMGAVCPATFPTTEQVSRGAGDSFIRVTRRVKNRPWRFGVDFVTFRSRRYLGHSTFAWLF